MQGTGSRGRWFRRYGALLVMCAALGGALIAPSAASANSAGYYCDISIGPMTDCASSGTINPPIGQNTWVGIFNNNHVYRPGGASTSVCEHTYVYGGGTISRRCANSYIQSYCDVYFYYNNGYTLDAHAGNNASMVEQVEGHVVIDSPEQQCA